MSVLTCAYCVICLFLQVGLESASYPLLELGSGYKSCSLTIRLGNVKLSRLVLILVTVTVVVGATYMTSPRFRYLSWALAGRSEVCPLSRTFRIAGEEKELVAAKDRILHASHLISQEAGLELWDTPKGRYWIPKGNRYVLPFNLAEMEAHIYGTGQHFVHAGDIVLDCGASDGDFTREALQAGAKLVVSIEISPAAVECLRRNLAQPIAQGRAIVYPKGVWDSDGSLTLDVSDANFAANSVVLHPEGSHHDVEVPLTTIDKIVGELRLPRVDFIKMDIEGAEVKALAGARSTIARFKPRLSIASEHKSDDEVTIPKAVRTLRPDYQLTCGPCSASEGHIRPSVLYFD
jgi:FkbM family methyltransferase